MDFISRRCRENQTLCFLAGKSAYSFMGASGTVAQNAPMVATNPNLTADTG
jgi:hypothetical protein